MHFARKPMTVLGRNTVAFLALAALHFATDQYHIGHRQGINQGLPYLLLISLYGWLVFHNRVLFERLYLQNRKRAYVGWLLLALGLCSINMVYILRTQFGLTRFLPHLVSLWVYTGAGLGVFVLYRQAGKLPGGTEPAPPPQPVMPPAQPDASFDCVVNGVKYSIPVSDILYLESLENYVRIHLPTKPLITRLTLKEAESKLKAHSFVRISKSHLINAFHLRQINADSVRIGDRELRIGKVYKRYVAEHLISPA